MKTRLAMMLPFFLLGSASMARTVSVHTGTAFFIVQAVHSSVPQALQQQVLQANRLAREAALAQAVQQIEDGCVDKNWPNANQMDLISKKESAGASTQDQTPYTMTIEAICTSVN